MNLYLKYRPDTLEQLKGNQEVVEALESMLQDISKCPHSFLLAGPTGCGKTTIGRIIANRLNCNDQDFKEVDSADFRGIDTIREIRRQSQFLPLSSPCRVWLIDECHKLTNDAQNALLKILEDTPKHVYFILCTTEPQKLLNTIKGRCTTFNVKPLPENLMLGLLKRVVREENETLDKEVYLQIARDSLGHPRNALQILDQVLRVSSEKRLETAKRSAEEQSQAIELCRALIGRAGWKKVASILDGLKEQEPENIRRIVLGYCSSILVKSENDVAGLVMENFIEPFYNTGFPGLVFACYSIVKD